MLSCCNAGIDGQPGDANEFFPVREEYRDTPPVTRFRQKAGKTLSARKWNASFSHEGYLDIVKVLRRIQSGGVHPSIKGEVWEFLLGCYDPKDTFEQRNQLRYQRRDAYGKLKSECQGIEPTVGSGNIVTAQIISEDGQPIQDHPTNGGTISDQEFNDSEELNEKTTNPSINPNVIQWKLTLHQIGLDVLRTDRTLVYYEDQKNRARLWDILAVYSWIDRDIGYCQGMSDLCSPIAILFENEADAFWCFEHLMRRVRENFKCTVGSIGVRSQLNVLASVMNIVDPKLHHHIEELDGGEYLFAFRMLMVLFRREFSFVDTMYLWELIWSMEYNPNLFSSYESTTVMAEPSVSDDKLLNQCGKFERTNMKAGQSNHQAPLSIFVMASLLETRNKRLLREAKGLDDVVKILNDITGNMDAKKTCQEALRIHTKYLEKIKTA